MDKKIGLCLFIDCIVISLFIGGIIGYAIVDCPPITIKRELCPQSIPEKSIDIKQMPTTSEQIASCIKILDDAETLKMRLNKEVSK